MILFLIWCTLVPYLLGSLSFSIIVSKGLYGKDIRKFGSGNAGMTNILRTFGKKAAALTLIGDLGKGALAVLLVKMQLEQNSTWSVLGVYLAAFFAVLGHIYPVYFGFKGGKAVSVATGTIIAIKPVLLIPLAIIFFTVLFIWKMVSLSSICCAVTYPVITILYDMLWQKVSPDLVWTAGVGSIIVASLVIWLHRGNLQRIIAGTEYKFFQKAEK